MIMGEYVMKTHTIGTTLATIFFLVAVLVTALSAQGEQPPQTEGASAVQGELASGDTVSLLIGYQGMLMNPNTGEAQPDGDYSMTLALYGDATGDVAYWAESKDVTVRGGLFNTQLGDTNALSAWLFDGRALWLGVQVGDDPEATPRQRLTAVPYAASLVPGAEMYGSDSSHILRVSNTSQAPYARAIHGRIWTIAPEGGSAAVRGENFGTSNKGVGVWGSQNGSGWGVYGNAPSGRGVYGFSENGTGVFAKSDSGYALYTDGEAVVTGDLTVSGDLKGVPRPIAMGKVNRDGTKISGTDNASVFWHADSETYRINIAGENCDSVYTLVTAISYYGGNPAPQVGCAGGSQLVIMFISGGANYQQMHFQFVIFKH
jgi:hypothetical protein